MTDRLKGCTVVFEKNFREDDAELLLNAIRCIRGVMQVEPVLSVHGDFMAEARIRGELGQQLLAIIYPDTYGEKK